MRSPVALTLWLADDFGPIFAWTEIIILETWWWLWSWSWSWWWSRSSQWWWWWWLKLTSFFFLSRLLLILGHRLHLAIVIRFSYFFLKRVFHSHSIHISFILSYSTDHQRIVFSISHFIHILMQKFVLLITDKISTCTPGLRLGKGECEGEDVWKSEVF